jgi:hypothetical protein
MLKRDKINPAFFENKKLSFFDSCIIQHVENEQAYKKTIAAVTAGVTSFSFGISAKDVIEDGGCAS